MVAGPARDGECDIGPGLGGETLCAPGGLARAIPVALTLEERMGELAAQVAQAVRLHVAARQDPAALVPVVFVVINQDPPLIGVGLPMLVDVSW